MKKYYILLGISLLLVAGTLLYINKLKSEGLFLHIDGMSWNMVTVSSPPLMKRIPYQQSPLKLCSLRHGKYLLSLTLQDGRILWWEFYHYDAGIRRRVDLYVQRISPNQFTFLQTYNHDNTLFEGSVIIDTISEQHPYRLDWF